jgi:hypothetical protein
LVISFEFQVSPGSDPLIRIIVDKSLRTTNLTLRYVVMPYDDNISNPVTKLAVLSVHGGRLISRIPGCSDSAFVKPAALTVGNDFIWNHPFLRGTVRRAILIVRHVFRWADASLFENPADAFRHMYRCVWDVGGEEHARSKIEESLTAETSIYSSQTNVRRRATRAAKKCLSVDALLFLT